VAPFFSLVLYKRKCCFDYFLLDKISFSDFFKSSNIGGFFVCEVNEKQQQQQQFIFILCVCEVSEVQQRQQQRWLLPGLQIVRFL
jgi:hypothetical protein